MNDLKKSNSVLQVMYSISKDMPVLFSINILITLLDGLHIPIMIVVVARFIDSALLLGTSVFKQGDLVVYGMLVMSGYIYTVASQQMKALVSKMSEDKLLYKLKPRMIKKLYSIDYLVYESAETQDLIHRVTDDGPQKFISVQRTILSLIRIIIQVLGIVYTLIPYMGWYAILVVSAVLPLIIVSSKGGKRVYAAEKQVGLITRKMNYLSDILSNREASHERTLFNYTTHVNNKYKQAHLFRSNYNTKALAKEVSRSKGINIILNLMILPLIFVLVQAVSRKQMSIGLFTSIIGSVMVLSRVLSGQLSELFLNLASHIEYAKDLHSFEILPENDGVHETVDEITFKSLIIKDLYFKYAKDDDYILKGINLELKKGQSYSLVGVNGAGKTTLTKILTGLYRQYEGEILLNGVDLKNFTYSQLRQVFSVVSQDFARYAISVKENIVFDQSNAGVEDVLTSLELDKFINHLPNKEDTLLGKVDSEGTDLSGGQWQMLAIARALFRQTPFVILDEPTSSLSPTAESEIYTKFLNFANERSLLMISHRLGSTKIADEIIVMDDGVIAESGSHEQLMDHNKLYANLFTKQRRLYHAED
ncbi:MAG: ABC transporter ATP-binding protein [Clostridiales bacterium]|nr:ABC transporter ATP-binding protein [Clostridiales bacterium]